jgi:hypothetical protein
MTTNASETPGKPVYRPLTSIAESQEAIDEVIRAADQALRIFDMSLTNRGFNSPARIELLRNFLVAGRAHRVLVALHDTETLERDAPRLLTLLRQFPMSVEIHRTVGQARNAMDPFVLADDHSVWHRMHHEQPRAIVALHSPSDAVPIAQRFEEIWELSEPCALGRVLGL